MTDSTATTPAVPAASVGDAATLPVVPSYTQAQVDQAVADAIKPYEGLQGQLDAATTAQAATTRELVAATTGVDINLLPNGPDVTREQLEQAAATATEWMTKRLAAQTPTTPPAAPRPSVPHSPLQQSGGEPLTPQQKAVEGLRKYAGR